MSDKEQISREKFIRLGAALGLGSVGASVIAGCGNGGGAAGNGGTPTDTDDPVVVEESIGGGPEIGEGQAIAEESEVTPNSAFPFIVASTGQQGVLVRLEDGEFAAYSAVCTHQACIVGYQPETQKLACPCHGSVFDPANGAAVLNGPANRPLPEVAIRVEDGEVVRV